MDLLSLQTSTLLWGHPSVMFAAGHPLSYRQIDFAWQSRRSCALVAVSGEL